MSYLKYNNTDIVEISDVEDAITLMDKITRIKSDRRIVPLKKSDNIIYPHRQYYDEYCLEIGDSYFMIPPEFIMINSDSTSTPVVTLRQENTMKQKHGKRRRTILIDLVFNSLEQINGFKVEGPDKDYYVDGLRPLLAQFKVTPFLPIKNITINQTFGIYTVVLQAINVSTINGFPEMMKAQLTLQEVNMMPYTEMPDILFKEMIDWDLFRYYYQSRLTEKHEYKKLQSLPTDKEKNTLKISIINPDVFEGGQATEYNILDIITDKKILLEDSKTNYKVWLDSTEDDIDISSFQFGYSNLLTNIQLAKLPSPTIQFLGGMDTIFNITLETKNESVIQKIEQCQIENDAISRNNPKVQGSVGFVKIESELLEFTGSMFVMIDSVATNTVPEFPGLYNVQINCVSYDIAQSSRENLDGFWPFEPGEGDNPTSINQSIIHKEQVIKQSMLGLITKVNQDNYAEWKLRKTELYPDLHLPTYEDIDKQIVKINDFRIKHGLSELPYPKYPKRPAQSLHGTEKDKKITFSYEGDTHVIDINSIQREEYDMYVDPDFYVFYPYSMALLHSINPDLFDKYYTQPNLNSYTRKVQGEPEETYEDQYGNQASGGSFTDRFISLARSFVGHSYVWGAYGDKSDSKGLVFDCSGLIVYCLNTLGVKVPRFTTSSLRSTPQFEKKNNNGNLTAGDLLLREPTNLGGGHVMIYAGNNSVIHAKGKLYGVVEEGISKVKYTSVYRLKSEYTDTVTISDTATPTSGNISTSSVEDASSTAEYIWKYFIKLGFSEIAIAGMLGNMQHESGISSNNLQNSREKKLGYNDEEYTNAVDKGTYTNFVNDKAGYGIVQFTYSGYKKQLLDKAKEKGVSISDIGIQCEVLYSQIQSLKPLLNAAKTPEEATEIFLMQYEKPSDPSESISKRKNYAKSWYGKLSGNIITIPDEPVPTTARYEPEKSTYRPEEITRNNISQEEIEQICKAIDSCAKNSNKDTKRYIAQLVFDRVNDVSFRWNGSVTKALSTFNIQEVQPSEETINIVKDVFINGYKVTDYSVLYFLTPDNPIVEFDRYDETYDRITTSEQFTFWGSKTKKSKHILFQIGDRSETNAPVITNENIVNILKCDPDRFGEPLLIDSPYYIGLSNDVTKEFKEVVNSTFYTFHTSFCDMYQYSCRGRLVKAFPTYMLCILDDNSAWFRGDRLWTNFYTHHSTVDIQCHATNDMPLETATVVINNIYHNLSRTAGGLSGYRVLNDKELFGPWIIGDFGRWVYKNTGIKLGFGAKLTSMMIELHQIIYAHAKLREGARIHLRCGYGSDPSSLGPMINGIITDVSIGDQISIVVSSDGNELLLNSVSSKENDTNNGWLGLFGLGENQESSNIIADLLCKRQGASNRLFAGWNEGSKYNIEHFGLYFSTSFVNPTNSWYTDQAIELSDAFESTTGNIRELGGLSSGAWTGYGINDLWNQWAEQYDILKDIYRANYIPELYIHDDIDGTPGDGEQNVVFNKYNMTPWDVCQVCTQQVPEYMLKIVRHQFDSRLYFGLPFWQEKYRYDIVNGDTLIEEAKTAAQVHYIDSNESIIDNQMVVTSRFTNTNIKVMYTRGKTATTTATIHSDITIDNSKQKTKILDTPISQNVLGPDQILRFLGYKVGYKSARRTGISNLIYGWNQMYQGQIILMGNPGIKPNDYLLINDSYDDIFGICLVREVIHSFSINTGFITTVVPGMIAFSTDQHSGMIESCKSLLVVLNAFSAFSNIRSELYNNYESNITLINLVDQLNNMVEDQERIENTQSIDRTLQNVTKGIELIPPAVSIIFKGKKALKTIKEFRELGWLGTTIKNAKNMWTAIRAFKIGKALMSLGTLLAPVTGGTSLVFTVALNAAIENLLEAFIEWLDNRNAICLLPLWWEGYPMASSIKGGEHILLIDSDATATEESVEDYHSQASELRYED